jgi:4-amino-4-deoxy-L-arabinose transferase-like glycosyltransferase
MRREAIQLGLLLAAALLVFLIGNASVPLLDRDEPRYAQCSRQMLQSGDWVVPRFLDELRAKKPPLIYWAQATAMALLGENAFAARLPSVLGVFLCAVLLAWGVRQVRGPTHALWATLVFCSSALTIFAAKSCLTDGLLLLWTTVAQFCLYALWRGKRSWLIVILLAIAIGLGLLTKGLIVGVLLATALVLAFFRWLDQRRGKSPQLPGQSIGFAKPIVGLLIAIAMVGPWVWLVHRRAPDFLSKMFHEAAGHAVSGMEGHAGPPGSHLVMIWADFLPWSFLLPAAIVGGWVNRDDPVTRFAMAAIIGPWLMVELAIRTKLPHYMLPTFPPLALLTADAVVRGLAGSKPGLASRGFVIGTWIVACVVVLIALLPWLAVLKFRPLPWTAMGLLAEGTALWAFFAARKMGRDPRRALATLGLGMMVSVAIFYGLFLPRAQFLRLSILAADVLKANGAVHPGDAVMVDYKEPSLAFYQGGTIRQERSSFVTSKSPDNWTPWMVITDDVWNHCSLAVRDRLQVVADFHGLSVADAMRVLHVIVVKKKSAPK